MKNLTPAGLPKIILLAVCLAAGSCAAPVSQRPTGFDDYGTQAPLLNSQRIRQRFGSYGIEVVRNSDGLRVADLYSLEDGRKVMRTLAVVIYPRTIPSLILAEHREIENGGSIGEVFNQHGWSIRKQNIYFGDILAQPGYTGVYAAMGGIPPTDLAVHVYRLSVGKSGHWLAYARIAEVHHPDYLELLELEDIYATEDQQEPPGYNGNDIRAILDTVAGVMNEFHLSFGSRSVPPAD